MGITTVEHCLVAEATLLTFNCCKSASADRFAVVNVKQERGMGSLARGPRPVMLSRWAAEQPSIANTQVNSLKHFNFFKLSLPSHRA